MKNNIILVGGGGHCTSCIDVIEQEGRFLITGISDIPEKTGQNLLGYPIVTSDDNLDEFISDNALFLTLGHIKSAAPRKQIFEHLCNIGGNFPTIVSPHAYVSPHARVGKGTIVMHGAIINAGATVGDNCIINSTSLIEHDAHIANHCHISTGTIINGGVEIHPETFIGSRTVVREYVTIGEKSIISCGLSILKNIPSGSCIKG